MLIKCSLQTWCDWLTEENPVSFCRQPYFRKKKLTKAACKYWKTTATIGTVEKFYLNNMDAWMNKNDWMYKYQGCLGRRVWAVWMSLGGYQPYFLKLIWSPPPPGIQIARREMDYREGERLRIMAASGSGTRLCLHGLLSINCFQLYITWAIRVWYGNWQRELRCGVSSRILNTF